MNAEPVLRKRTIALVGLMGAGKSSIGRRLANALGLPFVDADEEVEKAAGRSIPDIFEELGEAAFRDGERRVIARLLDGPAQVLATGGGAFISPQTRAKIHERGISVWLKADIDVLSRRLRRRSDRPLLKTADPTATLAGLLDARNPVYGEANVVVMSRDVPHEVIVEEIVTALRTELGVADVCGRKDEP